MPGLLLWWSQQSLARSNQRVQSAALAQLGSARAAQVLYPAAIPGPFAQPKLRVASLAPHHLGTAQAAHAVFPAAGIGVPAAPLPHVRVLSVAPTQVGTAHAALTLFPAAIPGPFVPPAGAAARMRALSFAPSWLGSAHGAQVLYPAPTWLVAYPGTGQLLYTGVAPSFIRAALPGTGLLLLDPFAPTLEGETIVVPPLPDNRLEMVARMGHKKKKVPRNWRGEPADFTDEEMLLLFGDDED